MTHRNRVFKVLAYGFVLLGMSLTALGVTWPSVAGDLDRSLAELGFVTLFFGSGYTLSTLISGRLAARHPIGHLLLGAAVAAIGGLSAMAIAPVWPLYLASAALLGASGGLTDAATNTYVAIRRGAREMGFIHGAFGIGAIAGPLLVTGLLALGASWRLAFVSLAVAETAYVAGLWALARGITVPTSSDHNPIAAGSLRSPVLALSVAVFFLYAGIASGAGVWAFTLLTEERGIAEAAGGLTVAAYWGGFTASRILLGFAGDRVDPDRVLRWSGIATAAGLAFFWWNPVPAVGLAALVFTGFAHGPVFPVEMLLTPRRFGAVLTATVVGFEIAAANIGGALLPGLMGLFVDRAGLEVVPPFLFVNALLLWGAIEALRVSSRDDIRRIAATNGT